MSFFAFISSDPILRALQLSILLVAVIAVYLVLFATRDILLRTRSFPYQLASIFLTAVLPIVGFLLYLLIRPSQTIKQREMEEMLKKIVEKKGGKKGGESVASGQ